MEFPIMLTARITDEQRIKLTALADLEGLSVSKFLRELIDGLWNVRLGNSTDGEKAFLAGRYLAGALIMESYRQNDNNSL